MRREREKERKKERKRKRKREREREREGEGEEWKEEEKELIPAKTDGPKLQKKSPARMAALEKVKTPLLRALVGKDEGWRALGHAGVLEFSN